MYTLRAKTMKNQIRYEQCSWKMGTARICGTSPGGAEGWLGDRGKLNKAKVEATRTCSSVPDRDGAGEGVAGVFGSC
jgi:hypothetical protein